MARVLLTCPLDGLSLGLAEDAIVPESRGTADREPHVHQVITLPMSFMCLGGHRWRVSGICDFILEREP